MKALMSQGTPRFGCTLTSGVRSAPARLARPAPRQKVTNRTSRVLMPSACAPLAREARGGEVHYPGPPAHAQGAARHDVQHAGRRDAVEQLRGVHGDPPPARSVLSVSGYLRFGPWLPRSEAHPSELQSLT